MPNRYVEILRTYALSILSNWIRATIVFLGVIVILVSLFTPISSPQVAIAIVSFGSYMGGTILWRHLAASLNTECRHLFPRYLGPQLLVFIMFASLLTIVWPALLALMNHFSLIAILAIAMGSFSVAGWGIYSLALLFPSMIALYACIIFGGKSWFVALLRSQHPTATLCILSLDIIFAILLLWKLSRTLSNRTFLTAFQIQSNNRPQSTGELNRQWQQNHPNCLFSWLESHRIYIPRDDSLWNCSKRWRQMSPVIAFWLFYPVIICFPLKRPDVLSVALPTLIAISTMPALINLGAWMKRWSTFDIESLLPLSRCRFIVENAVALARDILEPIAIYMLLLILVIAVHHAVIWTYLPIFILCFVVGSAFTFAAAAWLLPFRKIEDENCFFAIFAFFAPNTLMTLFWHFGHFYALIVTALIFACLACLLTAVAYRRWLLIEWG